MSDNKPQLRAYKTKGGRIVTMLETDPYTVRAIAAGEYTLLVVVDPKTPIEPVRK